MTLSSYRKYFPITSTDIYLNHAAVSPLSTKVVEDIQDMLARRSTGPVDVFPQLMEEIVRLKKNLATLIGAEKENIAVISNTSEGFNWLVNGLEWKKGDRVLLVEQEFPANIYPFLNLEKKGVLIDYVPLRNGFVYTEDIEKNIRPDTRLLSISFVEFLNGFRNNLLEIGKICKNKDILFSVDGIQGIGALPLDVRSCGIDFLSNGGHKWLMGPQGCGFMYLSPDLLSNLNPVFAGWLSVKDSWNFFDYRLDFLDDAGRFEIGTMNEFGVIGLRASTDLLIEAGTEKIEKHLLELGTRLIEGLGNLGYKYIGSDKPSERSGIYSFSGSEQEALTNFLQKSRIHLSLRNDVIRFAPHFYNTPAEIDEVIRLCSRFKSSAAG